METQGLFGFPPGVASCGIPSLYTYVSRVSHSSSDEEKMLIIFSSRVSESMNYHFPERRFLFVVFNPNKL